MLAKTLCFQKTERAIALSVFIIIISFSLKSQVINNSLLNYSLEEFYSCPNNNGQLNKAKYFYKPNYTSSDYFNVCCPTTTLFFSNVSTPSNSFGNQVPKSGVAYGGFICYAPSPQANYKEYIATKLINTLKQSSTYCITFYVSLAEISRIAISNIGANFTIDSARTLPPPINPITQYVLNPSIENIGIITDTISWVPIQKTYTANGTENFINIGNFRDNANTTFTITKPLTGNLNNDFSYYYIDDISVVEIITAKAAQQKTLTLCANTSYTLGTDSTWDATYQWQPTTGLSCTNCPNPIITAINNIKYFLIKQQCSATTKDSVIIQVYTPTLTANAGINKVLCPNQQTKLGINDSTAFASYNWLPNTFLNCNTCATPITNPNTTLTYTLYKTECSINSTSTVQVILKDTCNILAPETFIPQAFSPNGDGINETFVAKLANVNSAKLFIYNRWGSEVFKTLTTNNSSLITLIWDGRYKGELMPSSTYFYIIEAETNNGEIKNYRGFLVLMR